MTITRKATHAQKDEHIAKLETQLIAQGRQLETLRLELSKARSSQPAHPARTLPEHMAAAKALAMKLGQVVRVGGAS